MPTLIMVDWENVLLGLRKAGRNWTVEAIATGVRQLAGQEAVVIAVAPFRRVPKERAALKGAGFSVMSVRPGKNAADIVIAIETMDRFHGPSPFDRFVVVSGDQDFLPLLERLNTAHKGVDLWPVDHARIARDVRDRIGGLRDIQTRLMDVGIDAPPPVRTELVDAVVLAVQNSIELGRPVSLSTVRNWSDRWEDLPAGDIEGLWFLAIKMQLVTGAPGEYRPNYAAVRVVAALNARELVVGAIEDAGDMSVAEASAIAQESLAPYGEPEVAEHLLANLLLTKTLVRTDTDRLGLARALKLRISASDACRLICYIHNRHLEDQTTSTKNVERHWQGNARAEVDRERAAQVLAAAAAMGVIVDRALPALDQNHPLVQRTVDAVKSILRLLTAEGDSVGREPFLHAMAALPNRIDVIGPEPLCKRWLSILDHAKLLTVTDGSVGPRGGAEHRVPLWLSDAPG